MNINELLRDFFLDDAATLEEEIKLTKTSAMEAIRTEARSRGIDITALTAVKSDVEDDAEYLSVNHGLHAIEDEIDALPPSDNGDRQEDGASERKPR